MDELQDAVARLRRHQGDVTMDEVVHENYQRVIRDIDSITVEPSVYRRQSIREMSSLELPVIKSNTEGRIVVSSLLAIDQMDQVLWDSGDDACVDDEDFKVLEGLRRSLITVLIASDEKALKKLRSFSWMDNSFDLRYETFVFEGLLKVIRMQLLNSRMARRYLNRTFTNTPECVQLIEEDFIPEEIRDQQILEMLAVDLRECIIQMETRSMEYVHAYTGKLGATSDNLLACIDMLLVAASRLLLQTHGPEVFAGAGNSGVSVGNGQMRASQAFEEDVLWTLVPFIKVLYQQKRCFKEFAAPMAIGKADEAGLRQFLCKYAVDNALLAPREKLRVLYPKITIAPSEPRRYIRQEKAALMDDWGVIRACRGDTEKGAIVHNLSFPPWELISKEKEGPTIVDTSLLLILDLFINNRSNIFFFNNFVVFRASLMRERSPLEYLKKLQRPVIVQSMNTFNLFHAGKLVVYNSAMLSFIHWMKIMLGPEFAGMYKGSDLRPILRDLPIVSSVRNLR